LLSLALSIVLKPRGRDMPAELSLRVPTQSRAIDSPVAQSRRAVVATRAG
jgi:hypothetical protein